MNDTEIARLEEELRLTLPAAYVETARRLDLELEGLYGPLGKGVDRPLIWNGTEVLETNLLIRRQPAFYCKAPAPFAKDWPDPYLACGYESAGNTFYVIDTRDKDLPVQQILSKTKTLGRCTKHPTLESLREYALERYRESSTKHAKMWGQKKGPGYRPKSPAKAPAKKAAKAKPADARTVQALTEALKEAGFKIELPKRAHSVEQITADFLPELPKELLALYTACDGGACKRLGLRVFPLAEAARVARGFADWSPSMGYFPVVDSPQTDPCFVCIKGPLQGFVIFVHHDGPRAILARSLSRFFAILAQNRGGKGWNLESAATDGKPPKYAPFEFADEKRTAADCRRRASC
jgi:hypothetical protein